MFGNLARQGVDQRAVAETCSEYELRPFGAKPTAYVVI